MGVENYNSLGVLWTELFQSPVCIQQVRIVVENSSWLCVVPYWAVWPYETMLLPKHHVLRIEDLMEEERNGGCVDQLEMGPCINI